VVVGATAGALVLLFIVAMAALWVKPYRIVASSMEPTLHCARPGSGCRAGHSDRVLVSRTMFDLRSPHRGDVVAFHTPPAAGERCGSGGVYVKRIIALGGETWKEQSGFVYIDDKKLDEPYVKPSERDTATSYPARVIPKGEYFVLGDNRSQSCDSREWGPLKRSAIIGPVVATYWPPGRISIR
jgi:signal peptidase I